jgi:EAL domain-containing protein (putative c-di-GMP-specific phosphodiesterase class I)
LPIDGIKIDRSFVQRLDDSDRVLAVTEAVIGLARRLGMTIVAEGIETPSQLQAVRSLGCHFGQGFLLGRPLGAERFAETYIAGAASEEALSRPPFKSLTRRQLLMDFSALPAPM